MRERLTKGDVAKIEAELEHRKLVIRKEAAAAIAEAAAQGDRSENFEYHAAKKYRGENESRIRYLERVLKTAILVSDESADDEVGLNNTVHVYDVSPSGKVMNTSYYGPKISSIRDVETTFKPQNLGNRRLEYLVTRSYDSFFAALYQGATEMEIE